MVVRNNQKTLSIGCTLHQNGDWILVVEVMRNRKLIDQWVERGQRDPQASSEVTEAILQAVERWHAAPWRRDAVTPPSIR